MWHRTVLPVAILLCYASPLFALQKTVYSSNDSERFTDFQARKKKSKGYSTACDSEGFLLATKKTALSEGIRILLFSDNNDVQSTVKKITKRRKKSTGSKAKRLGQLARSLKKGAKRCSSDSGGGSGNGGGSGSTLRNPGPSENSIGTNLDWSDYFSSGMIFCDLFKSSREFVPSTNGSFNSGTLTKRSDGYPTFTPQGSTIAVSVLGFEAQGEAMPEGTYTLSFEGTGQLVVSSEGFTTEDQLFNTAGTYQIDYSRTGAGVWFNITQSDVNDPIRNIRFIMPGYVDTCTESSPFYTPFLEYISEFSVVRAMNLMQVTGDEYPCDNGGPNTSTSCERDWDTRTTISHQTQGGGRGVALEYLYQFANATNVDLWINIPHAATDNYMRNAAETLCNGLNSNLRLYVEYSNEVWNASDEFPQSTWAENMEAAHGLTQAGDPVAGQRYYVNRVIRMFEIFEEACDANRVVNVLGGWSGSATMNDLNLQDFDNSTINPNNVRPEALAIANYMGIWVVDYLTRTGRASTATVNEILEYMSRNLTEDIVVDDGTEESTESAIIANATVASRYNIPLIAYEGGQHLVSQSFENGDEIGATVLAVNRDSGIYDVFMAMYRNWFANDGALLMHFSGVDEYSVGSGAFGIKETYEQPLNTAHKFRASLDMQEELAAARQ